MSRTGQAIVSMTEQEDGAISIQIQAVGNNASWVVEEIGATFYGDGTNAEVGSLTVDGTTVTFDDGDEQP